MHNYRGGTRVIANIESTRTLFAGDTAVGNHEAGFYVVRHARGVAVFHNLAIRNCEGILVLDDSQKGGAGNAAISRNVAIGSNKFCAKSGDTPVNVKGGGILLLGATRTGSASTLWPTAAGRHSPPGSATNSAGLLAPAAATRPRAG